MSRQEIHLRHVDVVIIINDDVQTWTEASGESAEEIRYRILSKRVAWFQS